ncbi:MAG: superoxide dismutase family protein [Myxococcales bacterium]
MRNDRHVFGCCVIVLSAACSGHVELPSDGQASAGQPSVVAGGGAGAQPTTTGGDAGASSAGKAAAGAAGLVGAGGTSLAVAGQPAGGAASNEAEAQLLPTAGVTSGVARFTATGGRVELVVTLTGCSEGPHALHLHANAACADGGNAAGGHWAPQGELIPDVVCGADGSGQLSFSSESGVWSLGAPASSDVLRHALILHTGPSQPDPGARIACGIAVKAP